MKVCVLFNPKAGSAGQLDAIREAVDRTLGPDVLFIELGPKHVLERFARDDARMGFDLIIVAGGDGTIHSVVNGLGPNFPDVPLAILPLGTGNDFCRTLGVPLDPVAAVEALRGGRARPLDVARVEGGLSGFMINAATGGFSGRVATEVTSDLKASWGPLAYVRGAVGPVVDLPQYRVTLRLDGGPPETFDALNVVIANCRTAAGGFLVAPAASPEDGKLDVVIVRAGDALDLSVIAARLMHGDYLTDENVDHRLAARVELESDPPMPFSVDGEPAEAARWTFTVVPGALRVETGPDYVANPPPEPAVEDDEEDDAPAAPPAAVKGVGQRLFGLLAGVLLLVKRTPTGYAAGAFVSALAVVVFAWLATGVAGGRWAAFNEAVMRSVEAHQSTDLTRLALAATSLAGTYGTPAVVGVVLLVMLARKRYLDAATFLAAVGGAQLIESILKPIFAVARPEVFPHLAHAGGFSFPSGHAVRGTAMFGFLAGLLVVTRPRSVWRWVLAALCVAVAVAICWSRVYLGVHWPTDVAAGAVASAGWVAACLMARYYAMTRPRKQGSWVSREARTGANVGRSSPPRG